MELTLIQKIAVGVIPVLFAITLHEVAHGRVALLFGDHTAKLAGRLSLNPVHHIDLLGTIVIPLLLFLATGFAFGWAKPVPIDPRNMPHPRRDMAFVALAGPLSNILMACFWALVTKQAMMFSISHAQYVSIGVPLIYMGIIGIQINIVLGVLNLLPLPPLDGSNVIMGALPRRAAYYYSRIQPYGFFILVALIITNLLSKIMEPLFMLFGGMISTLFGLPMVI